MLSDFNLSSISPSSSILSSGMSRFISVKHLADGSRLSVQRSFALTFPT